MVTRFSLDLALFDTFSVSTATLHSRFADFQVFPGHLTSCPNNKISFGMIVRRQSRFILLCLIIFSCLYFVVDADRYFLIAVLVFSTSSMGNYHLKFFIFFVYYQLFLPALISFFLYISIQFYITNSSHLRVSVYVVEAHKL